MSEIITGSTEASAKVRMGNPVDVEEDCRMNVWAGVLPLRFSAKKPIADAKLREGVKMPSCVSDYKKS